MEYATREQAQQAVSQLSNQNLMGRLVYVREVCGTISGRDDLVLKLDSGPRVGTSVHRSHRRRTRWICWRPCRRYARRIQPWICWTPRGWRRWRRRPSDLCCQRLCPTHTLFCFSFLRVLVLTVASSSLSILVGKISKIFSDKPVSLSRFNLAPLRFARFLT